MIFKMFGGFLIIAATSSLGLLFSYRYSSRPKELRSIRRLLQMLETEIVYGATPLPHALCNIAKRADGNTGIFLELTSQLLSERTFLSVKEAWVHAVNTVLGKTALTASDMELIKSFGSMLGCSDREDQQKHFSLLYIQLKQQEDMAEEERKRNARMYKSLGFLFGAAVFIMLV